MQSMDQVLVREDDSSPMLLSVKVLVTHEVSPTNSMAGCYIRARYPMLTKVISYALHDRMRLGAIHCMVGMLFHQCFVWLSG